jgi:8-oxo-dGTP pyrophosphatase MutT (NUDIX family)
MRESVRALVLDPDDCVLLVRFEFPQATVWALPGGGVEPDEDPLEALRRELHEELGLAPDEFEIGPYVWDRTIEIDFVHGPTGARWAGQHDRIHLVRTPRFEPQPAFTWEQLRAERMHELRWWSPDELRQAERTPAPPMFAPRRLLTFLDLLRRDGPPPSPIDTGP